MMLVYAHRGLSGSYPENTLLAFRQAIVAGVDGIEFDIHATADGIPVVIHDRDVGRTTDGTGNVDELPLALLQSFDAGTGERVPTLAEVLDLVGNAVHLDVEIKGSDIADDVLRVLARHPSARWAISSFNWHTLREVRRLDAAAELWPLTEEVDDTLLTIAAELGSPAVSLFTDALTAESAGTLHDAGLHVVTWTVNDVAEAVRVRGLGAYALCTDFPDRIDSLGRCV